MCNRCADELPSNTPVCPRCGPLTLGEGFGASSLPPPAFVASLSSGPAGEPTSPVPLPFPAAGAAASGGPVSERPSPSPAPPALPAPAELSAKQARKQRAREALAARARAQAGESETAFDPSAVSVGDDAPLAAFTRPGAVTLLAVFDLVVGGTELFVAWAAFQGRTGGPAGPTTDVATYGGVGLVYVVAGLGLLGLRQYGRYAQLALAVLMFVSGFGPAIAAILLVIYLMRPGVKVLLGDRDPRSLSLAEQTRLAKDTPSPLLVPASVALQTLLAFLRLVPVLTVIAG